MADRNVTVRLSADVQNYISSMDQAASATERTATAAEQAGRAAQGAGGQVGGARQAFGEFGDTMRGINRETPQFAAGLTLIGGGITAMMTSLMRTGIEYNSLQQVAGKALETMTDSAGEAAEQMDRLNEFASTSPFFRDTWLEAQRQLMAFGMEAENVVPTLEGVEEAVAAIGGGDQEIRRLVEILGQIQGQGRITARELQRMGQMGIDAAGLMGDAMGMTGDEIRTQITAGAIDAETAIEALTTGMMTNFEGSADAIRETMDGAKNDLIAAWRDLGSVLAEPFVSAEGGGMLVEVTNMAADAIRAFLELPDAAVQAVGGIVAAFGGLFALGGIWGLLETQLRGFWTGAMNALRAVGDLGAALVSSMGGWRRFAAGAGIAVAAIAGFAILKARQQDAEDFAASASTMGQELVRAAEGGQAFADVEWERGWVGAESVGDLGSAMERLADGAWHDGLSDFAQSIGLGDSQVHDLRANIENLDEAMTNAFVEGNFEYAAAGLEEIMDAADGMGLSVEEVIELFPGMVSQLEDAATAAGYTADVSELLADGMNGAALEALFAGESWEVVAGLIDDGAEAVYNASDAFDDAVGSAGAFKDAFGEVAEVAGEASDSLSSVVESMTAMGLITLDAEQQVAGFDASIRALNETVQEEEDRLSSLKEQLDEGAISQAEYDEAVKDTLITLDNTDAGDNYRGMLRDLYTDTVEGAEGMAVLGASQEELSEHLRDGFDELVHWRTEATGNAEAAEEWARELFNIPDDVSVDTFMDMQAQTIAEETKRTIDEIPDFIDVLLGADDDEAREVITALLEGDYEAAIEMIGEADKAQAVLDAFIEEDWETLVDILTREDSYIIGMQELLAEEHSTHVDVDADTGAAELQIDEASRDRIADILADSATGLAESDLNNTARDRIADILADPDSRNAEGELNETARRRIAAILADPDTWNAEGELDRTAATRIADIIGNANTWQANSDLNHVARDRVANIQARVSNVVGDALSWLPGGATGGIAGRLPGLAGGGITGLAGYSNGGRLPYTGLGTDMILGIGHHGMPVARVDDGEFITRETMTRKYLPALWAINRDDPDALKRHVAGYAGGGTVGAIRPREFPATPGALQPRQITDAMRDGMTGHSGGGSVYNVYAPATPPRPLVNELRATERRIARGGAHP